MNAARRAGVLAFLLACATASGVLHAAAGRTAGAAAVSPAGESRYSVPIFAPPGAKGMAPKLALTYGHRNPGLLFGEGWNLTGQSEISVCPKTWAQDGLSRAVRLDGTDRFCLDGAQLKLESGVYGQNGAVYRTEIESYARVVSNGVVGNTPDSFAVEQKDGLTYYYGTTANSRIESVGTSTAHTWALARVVDRSGNRIEFNYNEDGVNGSYQLAAVNYASNPSLGLAAAYAITFTYATQPAAEVEAGYLAGGVVRDVKRATQIDVTYNGTVVRRYNLAYEGALSSAGHSRLASITECGGSSGADCLAPLAFTYQDGTPGINATAAQSFSTPAPSGAMALDVNGDGKTDLVYPSSATSGDGTWMVALATGAGGFGTPINTGISNVNYTRAVPIDYNADGLDDILVPYSGTTWWVLLGTTTGFAAPSNTSATSTGSTAGNAKALDINGDGLEDLVEANSSRVWYWQRNLGGSFDSSQDVISPVAPGTSIVSPVFPDRGMKRRTRAPDFNGDGHGDFIVTFNTPYWDNFLGTWINMPSVEAKLGGSNGSFLISTIFPDAILYLDLNGDRNTDIAYELAGTWFYHLSVGTALAGPFAGPSASGQDPALAVALDWDGNGTEDIVAPHSDGYWRVMRSTGLGFATVENPGVYFGNLAATFVGDTNGDSLDDLIYANAAGTFGVNTHLGVQPDLLKTVTDGYNNVVTFAYSTLAQSSYTKGSGATFPYMDFQGPLSIVSQVTLPDGTLGTYTVSYQYYYAQVHRQGRGFAGFGALFPYDSRTGNWDYHYYLQSFPYTGLEYSHNVYQADWNLIIHDLASLTYYAFSSGTEVRYFPYVTGNDHWDREVGGAFNGAQIRTVTSTIILDPVSGTPTDTTVITTEGAAGNGVSPGRTWTQRTYVSSLLNDTTSWCLGKPQTVQQINSHSGFGGTSQTRTVSTTWNATSCRPTATYVEPGNGSWQIATTLGYDSFGNLNSESVTGAGLSARTTATDYGATGQFPVSVTNAQGETATQAWNYGLGVPISQTDPNGVSLSYQHDNFGRKTRETRPDGTWTAFDWYPCTTCDPRVKLYVVQTDYGTNGVSIGQLVRYLDPEDREIYTYRWISALADYARTTRGFDNRGRVVYEYFPYLATTSLYYTAFAYDLLNRKTQEYRVISASNPGAQAEYTYYEGLTIRQLDAEMHLRTTVSDAIGKTVKTSDPNGYAVLFDFDSFGQPVRVTDSAGNTLQTNTYNLRGYRTASTDVDMGGWTYTPNALGEVVSQTDANAQTTSFQFDALGRMIQRVEPNAGGTITNWFIYGTSAALKEIGKLKYQQVYGTGVTGYYEWHYYDALGRLIQTNYNDSSSNYYIDRTYNATTGLPETVEYPASGATRLKVKYEYAGSDLIRAKDFNVGTVFWQANNFDPRMNVTDESLGNGLKTVRNVDLVTGLLASIQTGVGGGTSMQNLAYQWDKVGNLTQRQDVNQSLTEAFSYDPLDRLTQSTRNGVTNLAVSYNSYGNITSKADQGGAAYTYTYHASKIHAVASTSSGLSFSYDANGNITSRTGASVTWYANNKPKTINNGPDSSTFEYAADGQYWKQTAAYGTGPETTTYLGGIWEKVVGSTITAYRNYVKVGGRTVAIKTLRSNGTNDTYYPLSDHLGSTESITNASAALIVKESFDAFGKRRGSNWAGVPSAADNMAIANTTRRGFAGHTMLDNVGLVHMNGRVYDPTIGRFLSADPNIDGALDTQAWNRYTYVKNNPLSFVDPSGYWSLRSLVRSIGRFIKRYVADFVVAAVSTAICGGNPYCGFAVATGASYVSRGQTSGGTISFAMPATTGAVSARQPRWSGGVLLPGIAGTWSFPAGQSCLADGCVGASRDFLEDLEARGGITSQVAPDAYPACTSIEECRLRAEAQLEAASIIVSGALFVYGGEIAGAVRLLSGWRTARAAINPKIYDQLGKQLARDGAKSIHRALRSAEQTLAEHQAKLQQILRDGGYPSQVQTTIRNVESQIETLKKFIADRGL